MDKMYDYVFNKLQDPRNKGVFLMESPLPVLGICACYIYFVCYLGPRVMKDRKPFSLRNILVAYNALQTAFSAIFFCLISKQYFKLNGGFRLSCVKLDTEIYTYLLCYVYFLSKISELADTVFFVLKKKNSHISFLHVFHHSVMVLSVWVGVKFHPGGSLAFFGIPNVFVHIWMYLYYMMAALGPDYQKYIWWKRHITELQLAQFAIIMLYMLCTAINCQYPKILLYWIIALDSIFVFLFCDFYLKAYKKKLIKIGNGYIQKQGSNGYAPEGKTNGHITQKQTENVFEEQTNKQNGHSGYSYTNGHTHTNGITSKEFGDYITQNGEAPREHKNGLEKKKN